MAGLGNPGPRYEGTRHNIGFEIVDELAGALGVREFAHSPDAFVARADRDGCRFLLCKPRTWMNRSGLAVRRIMMLEGLTPADVLVVCDDTALPLGRLRLRREGSAGGHNGLASVLAELGTTVVPRLRCGVGGAPEGADLADHVLDGFAADERDAVRLLVRRAAEAVLLIAAEGHDRAMSRVNASPSAADAPAPSDAGAPGGMPSGSTTSGCP